MTQGSTEIVSYSHGITSPRDAATGQATGKRQHEPIVIRKEIDRATPLLLKALVDNNKIDAVEIKLYRPNPSGDGTLQNYFSIELENVRVSSISKSQDPPEPSKPLEEVSFTYQKITWTWVDGRVSAEDNWESPVS
ncbi:MAG: type VI secretion system tube protein TssD [Candidatus Paceibacterota bacterium]